MNEGIHRAIADARHLAERNVEYFDREIAKAEREQARLTEKIAEMREERNKNIATLTEAEAMLK